MPATELRFLQRHARRQMDRHGYRPAPTPMSLNESARYLLRVWPEQRLRMAVWRWREALQMIAPRFAGPRVDESLMTSEPAEVRR